MLFYSFCIFHLFFFIFFYFPGMGGGVGGGGQRAIVRGTQYGLRLVG